MLNTKNKLLAVFCAPALLLLSSCTPDDPAGTETKITFRLRTSSAMDGRITIDKAYLKLSSIEIKGSVPNGDGTHVIEGIPPDDPPFHLTDADSSGLYLPIPPGLYSQLAFDLVLAQDGYTLVAGDPPLQETPTPTGDDDTGAGNVGSQAGSDSGQANDGNQHGDDDSGVNSGGDDSNGEDETPPSDADEDDDGTADDPQHDDHEKGDKGNHHKDKDKGKHKKDGEGHNGDDDGRITDADALPSVDLDNFFRNARPGLLVIGTYQNNGKAMRLIFVGTGVERLTVPARQNDSPEIILTGSGSAEVTFDPERWFSSVTPAEIETAILQQYQGQPVLFIHPDHNSNLFQAVMPRIQESADLNFAGSAF